jgi:hypothetical protein
LFLHAEESGNIWSPLNLLKLWFFDLSPSNWKWTANKDSNASSFEGEGGDKRIKTSCKKLKYEEYEKFRIEKKLIKEKIKYS